jgi:transcriptional regulator with XRE-family HTH domain
MKEEVIKMQVGAMLRGIREKAGLSRPELGKLVGIHRNTLERYENGFDMPIATFCLICEALKTKPCKVLEGLGK